VCCEFKTEIEAFDHFDSEFGEHEEKLKSRCFFITTHSTPSEATPPTTIPNPTTLTEELEITVATTMAWDREIDRKPTRSLHWVGPSRVSMNGIQ